MKRNRLVLSTLFVLALLLLILPSVLSQDTDEAGMSADMVALIHDVRVETARFHNLDTALEAGYGEFLSCFRHGEHRGMGQHYVNGELVGDDMLDPLQPEALVYEPLEDGTMVLTAFEYIVFADVWDPEDTGREAPTLYGQEFSLKTTIPDTPPLWALHIWLWTHNPEGLFADYNPIVSCPDGQESIDMALQ